MDYCSFTGNCRQDCLTKKTLCVCVLSSTLQHYAWHPGIRCGNTKNQLISNVHEGNVGSNDKLPLSGQFTIRQSGFDLPRQQWSLLNRFHTAQGHCSTCGKRWRLTYSDLCFRGDTQTMSHIVNSCPLTKSGGKQWCSNRVCKACSAWGPIAVGAQTNPV